MTHNTFVLSGGAEFTPECRPLEQSWLKLIRHHAPPVVIIPAAAAAHATRAERDSIHYFKDLRTKPFVSMIVSPETANDQVKVSELENSSAYYLTDGSPLDVVNVLKKSEALETLLFLWRSEPNQVLVACGASAMAFCDVYLDGGVWEPGLGLLKGAVILPHHQKVAGRFTYSRLAANLPPNTKIIGIDDTTGIMVTNGTARVIGSGLVTVYTAEGEANDQDYPEYSAGKTLPFPLNLTPP